MDEAALLAAWQGWSRDAASRLARRYCWIDHSMDADDCMQEIALALIHVARTSGETLTRNRKAAEAYVYRCAVHQIYAAQRRKARRSAELMNGGHRDAIQGAAALDEPTSEGGVLADMLSGADAGIEAVEAAIDRALLNQAERDAVDQLPEELRAVMRMRLEGLYNADIARYLEMPLDAVCRCVKMACKRLRRNEALRAFVDWNVVRRRRG